MDIQPSQSTPALQRRVSESLSSSNNEVRFCMVNSPTPLKSTSETKVPTRKKGHNKTAQSSCMGIISSFPIIQELPKRGKTTSKDELHNSNTAGKRVTQAPEPITNSRQKSSEVKFKIEPIGSQLADDDDLDMCPARTRPDWPKKITPWWNRSHPKEKPPYSYATLIAHAILSSKDGRLTLNSIYQWISEQYPCYVLGEGGWQNSIRHNLSLKREYFLKLDRRPTQANPGKGGYWTLMPGKEKYYIDQITQAGNPSRRHHDIGLTAELSIQNRRGSCFYSNADNSKDTNAPPNMHITGPSDYAQTNKSSESAAPLTATLTPSSKSTSMFSMFRMNTTPSEPVLKDNAKREINSLHKKRTNKKRRQQPRPKVEVGSYCEDEYDSGVDVSSKYVSRKQSSESKVSVDSLPVSQDDTSGPASEVHDPVAQDIDWLALLQNTCPGNDFNSFAFPCSSYAPCVDGPATESSGNVLDDLFFELPYADTTWCSQENPEPNTTIYDSLLSHDVSLPAWLPTGEPEPIDTPPVKADECTYPALLTSSFEPKKDQDADHFSGLVPVSTETINNSDELLEHCLKEVLDFQWHQNLCQQANSMPQPTRRGPVTINLSEDEVTAKYLHFEEESECEESGGEDDGEDTSAAQDDIAAITQGLASSALGEEWPSSILPSEYHSMRDLLYS